MSFEINWQILPPILMGIIGTLLMFGGPLLKSIRWSAGRLWSGTKRVVRGIGSTRSKTGGAMVVLSAAYLLASWIQGMLPGPDGPSPDRGGWTIIDKAFDAEKRLVKDLCAETAGRIRSRELTEEKQIRDAIEAGRIKAEKIAWTPLATQEAELLNRKVDDDGNVIQEYSVDRHAELLESYAK